MKDDEKLKEDIGTQMSEKKEQKPEVESRKSRFDEKKKLSYKEQREFDLLGKEIEDLAKEKSNITQKLYDGTLPFDELQKLSNRIGEVTQLLDEKELRWLELSE